MVSSCSLREKTSDGQSPRPRALQREERLSWFPLSLQDTRRRASGLPALGWGALSLRQALFSGRWSLFQVGAGCSVHVFFLFLKHSLLTYLQMGGQPTHTD